MGQFKNKRIIKQNQNATNIEEIKQQIEHDNNNQMEIVGGYNNHIVIHAVFFIGFFSSIYLILSETNRLIWSEEATSYKVKYYDLTYILPKQIQDISYPSNYSMFQVLIDSSNTQQLKYATAEDEEVWFLLTVPSIDQATFIGAPFAKDLSKYIEYRQKLDQQNYQQKFGNKKRNLQQEQAYAKGQSKPKKITLQYLTFNFTQQPVQMIPDYLFSQGKYLASVINYLRKEEFMKSYIKNNRFIIFSHWSGALVTYRALQILYDSGLYSIDDFLLINYDPLFFGGPSLINERMLQSFYQITKGSEVFNKQTNVLNFFSMEESNLIVDHHFALDQENQGAQQQYFISSLFKNIELNFASISECMFNKAFLKYFVYHIYELFSQNNSASVFNQRLYFQPLQTYAKVSHSYSFNKKELLQIEENEQKDDENKYDEYEETLILKENIINLNEPFYFKYRELKKKISVYSIDIKEDSENDEEEYLLSCSLPIDYAINIYVNDEYEIEQLQDKHIIYHSNIGRLLILRIKLKNNDNIAITLYKEGEDEEEKGEDNYMKRFNLPKFNGDQSQIDFYIFITKIVEGVTLQQETLNFNILSFIPFYNPGDQFALNPKRKLQYQNFSSQVALYEIQINNFYLPFELCLHYNVIENQEEEENDKKGVFAFAVLTKESNLTHNIILQKHQMKDFSSHQQSSSSSSLKLSGSSSSLSYTSKDSKQQNQYNQLKNYFSEYKCLPIYNYEMFRTTLKIAGPPQVLDKILTGFYIRPFIVNFIIQWVHQQQQFIINHVIAIQLLLTYCYLSKRYLGEDEDLTLIRLVLYNYRLLTISIFLSTIFAYYFPIFIKEYGFLGYDLPIPQNYHTSPYFFLLWGANLLGAVSIYVMYYGCVIIAISVFKFLGNLWYKFFSFILCGSHIFESFSTLLLLVFIFYSSLINVIVILIFMHYIIVTYRGRLQGNQSFTVNRTLTFFQSISFTHLMLLLDYASYEQIHFIDTGANLINKSTSKILSPFHNSLLQCQHLYGLLFALMYEEDIAEIFTKCKYLVLLCSLYCFMFGVGWLYRARIAITYLLLLIELICLIGGILKFWIWINNEFKTIDENEDTNNKQNSSTVADSSTNPNKLKKKQISNQDSDNSMLKFQKNSGKGFEKMKMS